MEMRHLPMFASAGEYARTSHECLSFPNARAWRYRNDKLCGDGKTGQAVGKAKQIVQKGAGPTKKS